MQPNLHRRHPSRSSQTHAQQESPYEVVTESYFLQCSLYWMIPAVLIGLALGILGLIAFINYFRLNGCSLQTGCDDGNPCTLDSCSNGVCLHQLLDGDQDGIPCGIDCNDADVSIGMSQLWSLDNDGDGFGEDERVLFSCHPPTTKGNWVNRIGDCNDDDHRLFPGSYTYDHCRTVQRINFFNLTSPFLSNYYYQESGGFYELLINDVKIKGNFAFVAFKIFISPPIEPDYVDGKVMILKKTDDLSDGWEIFKMLSCDANPCCNMWGESIELEEDFLVIAQSSKIGSCILTAQVWEYSYYERTYTKLTSLSTTIISNSNPLFKTKINSKYAIIATTEEHPNRIIVFKRTSETNYKTVWTVLEDDEDCIDKRVLTRYPTAIALAGSTIFFSSPHITTKVNGTCRSTDIVSGTIFRYVKLPHVDQWVIAQKLYLVDPDLSDYALGEDMQMNDKLHLLASMQPLSDGERKNNILVSFKPVESITEPNYSLNQIIVSESSIDYNPSYSRFHLQKNTIVSLQDTVDNQCRTLKILTKPGKNWFYGPTLPTPWIHSPEECAISEHMNYMNKIGISTEFHQLQVLAVYNNPILPQFVKNDSSTIISGFGSMQEIIVYNCRVNYLC